MTINLTDKEVALLKQLLGLDLDCIGFDAKAQRVFNGIRQKLKASGK